jgi:hypothetical protein
MIVLMTRLSCMMPPAMTPGMPRTTSRRTPGVMTGRRSFSRMPARLHDTHSSANWMNPASATPQTSARPVAGSSPQPISRANRSEPISTMLSSTGAAAAMAKRCRLLRMPPSSATSDMNRR